METLGGFPNLPALSLDEAFLDVTASVKLFGAPSQIASDLRARIASDVGLPSSAGIASVSFVAKIASDVAKPNGQKEVAPGEAREFLAPLPVGRLWGVGPKTEAAQTLGFAPSGRLQLLSQIGRRSGSPVFQRKGFSRNVGSCHSSIPTAASVVPTPCSTASTTSSARPR
jgi:hypothetical protein